MATKPGFDTLLIHAGELHPRIAGSITMPIFQSSTFETGAETSYHDVRYVRLSNTPNHHVLHAKLAALEKAEAALVTSSGMAAISTTLLSILGPGDHLLVQDCLYGGTHDLLNKDLHRLGIAHTALPLDRPHAWRALLTPTTRAIYVETLSNPLLQVCDLDEVARFAKEHGLVSIVDNTFASPFNFVPAEHGFDLSVHSATKYLNGHSDLAAGAVIGSARRVEQVKHKLDHLGGTLDPHACFLLHRGLKTLAVRMRHINQSAARIAHFLEEHPAVQRVHYPGLASHPQHALATRLLGGFGGVLSFELKAGKDAAERLMARSRLCARAPSLGGAETLITRPAASSHLGIAPEERKRLGITDSLVRLSVGLETTDDLIEDLREALRT